MSLRSVAAGDVEERIVLRALWELVFCGRALAITRLAARLGGADDVVRRVRRLAEAGVLEMDQCGQIIGAHGVTLAPAQYIVRIGERRLYARAAGAALRLLGELGESGSVSTRCPRCARPVSVCLVRGRVRRAGGGLHDRLCSCRFCPDVVPREKSHVDPSPARHALREVCHLGRS